LVRLAFKCVIWPGMPYVRMASAPVLDEDYTISHSHSTIVARGLGTPAVIGTGNVTEILKDGLEVTVDGSKGVVYAGRVSSNLRRRTVARR